MARSSYVMSDQHLFSRAPLVSRRVDVRQAAGRKTIAESLSQHDEKHVVLTPLSDK
jgi:hypothetical protein